MTLQEILEIADKKNKLIRTLSEQIKDEVKHLPDINSVGRISNHIESIKTLNIELETLKNVII